MRVHIKRQGVNTHTPDSRYTNNCLVRQTHLGVVEYLVYFDKKLFAYNIKDSTLVLKRELIPTNMYGIR